MNENLINNVDFTINKCYICFDSCDDKSPCDCDVYVHMECLIKFAKKNKKNSVICTSLSDFLPCFFFNLLIIIFFFSKANSNVFLYPN